MRKVVLFAVLLFAMTLVSAPAADAAGMSIKINNTTDWLMRVYGIQFTKDGSPEGPYIHFLPAKEVPAHGSTTVNVNVPVGANDGPDLDFRYFVNLDTAYCVSYINPLPEDFHTFGLYYDTSLVDGALYFGYGADNPTVPVFCTDSLDYVAGNYTCNAGTPGHPEIGGSIEITPVSSVPTLTEWGIIVLVVTLILSAAFVMYRRRKSVID